MIPSHEALMKFFPKDCPRHPGVGDCPYALAVQAASIVQKAKTAKLASVIALDAMRVILRAGTRYQGQSGFRHISDYAKTALSGKISLPGK